MSYSIQLTFREELDPDNFMTVETKELKSDLPEIYGYNDQVFGNLKKNNLFIDIVDADTYICHIDKLEIKE